ncbi:hypothetical protein ANN_19483 [Periplaneta americana]|uniref:Uncharacterized protein n=1 Tax=Periplaneta americana TaxID=6978 RepID=A0ABQ8SAB8_PERAM|nr:hypothetical protein ANN_19483 [Periplaneta americana]
MSKTPGSAAESAALSKHHKYKHLTYICVPFAVETFGSWCSEAKALISTIGRSLVQLSGDPRSSQYLRQRIGITIQREGTDSCHPIAYLVSLRRTEENTVPSQYHEILKQQERCMVLGKDCSVTSALERIGRQFRCCYVVNEFTSGRPVVMKGVVAIWWLSHYLMPLSSLIVMCRDQSAAEQRFNQFIFDRLQINGKVGHSFEYPVLKRLRLARQNHRYGGQNTKRISPYGNSDDIL